MPVIDVHAHGFPPEWLALLEAEGPRTARKLHERFKALYERR